MRSFDLVTDPSNAMKKNTWLGGTLTILLCIVGVFFLITEIKQYKDVEITKNMILNMDIKEERVLVNLSMDLFNAPCASINLDIHDQLRHHIADVPMRKEKLQASNETLHDYEETPSNEERFEHIKEDLLNNLGCRLSTKFELDKVSGRFQIGFQSTMNEYLQLKSLHPEIFEKLDLSYQIRSFYFGTEANEENMHIIENLVKDLGLSHELLENYSEFKPLKMKDFLASFWIEIIPYTLEDKRKNFSYSSYQNSFNMKITPLINDARILEVPMLEFNYKFSPLTSYYTIFNSSYRHIFATFFIFIGGIYSFLSFVNNIAYNTFKLQL